ncbi:MAG: hypothetical protein WCK15_24410, partial [Pirellula sp.]
GYRPSALSLIRSKIHTVVLSGIRVSKRIHEQLVCFRPEDRVGKLVVAIVNFLRNTRLRRKLQ